MLLRMVLILVVFMFSCNPEWDDPIPDIPYHVSFIYKNQPFEEGTSYIFSDESLVTRVNTTSVNDSLYKCEMIFHLEDQKVLTFIVTRRFFRPVLSMDELYSGFVPDRVYTASINENTDFQFEIYSNLLGVSNYNQVTNNNVDMEILYCYPIFEEEGRECFDIEIGFNMELNENISYFYENSNTKIKICE